MPQQPESARLSQRGILIVSGEDRRAFLQGLISNDVGKIAPVEGGAGRAVHAALLTPQGKFLHEFFIAEQQERFLVDAEAARLEDLRKRLSMYRLRSKVQVAAAPDLAVHAAWGGGAAELLGLDGEAGSAGPFGQGIAFVDPRLAAAGCRVILPASAVGLPGFAPRDFAEWDQFRLGHGLADGSRDMAVDKAILLENGFEEWGSVDFQKGCYMGQELTARTKYRALIKKRLMPVEIEGPVPEPGTPVLDGGEEAGEMRSASGARGLALIRLEALAKGTALTAGQATVRPFRPGWMTLPVQP